MAVQPIEPRVAERLHRADPEALLIDVRSPAEFAASHIAGSRNVPLETVEAWARDESAYADRAVTVTCGGGTRARRAAASLEAAGFARVGVLDGGLKGWSAAGLPVRTGAGAISLERQVRIAAGSLVVLGLLIAWSLTPYGALLSLVVGLGLVFAGVTDTCGMGLVLAKAPWNRKAGGGSAAG